MSWLSELKYNPLEPLLASDYPPIIYWTRRELLKQTVADPKEVLWDLKIPMSILRKQNSDGSWTYPTKKVTASVDYDQVETYRQLGFLVEMFGFDRRHDGIIKAADYIFSKQSNEGDFRGIYANQYSPNYTAAILELLVKAGYEDDKRVLSAFSWLESAQQNDGGWALALRTRGRSLDAIYTGDKQLTLDRDKPFSHLITGIVLRAYAAHPVYKCSDTAKSATELLASRFFSRDKYPDKNRIEDWTRFSFPFWQTDILTSLDIIGTISPDLAQNRQVLEAKKWFISHQQTNGLFTGHLLKDRYHDLQFWYSFAVCRAFNRFQ